MKAIILAGGQNTRLANDIQEPKTLLRLGKETIIERQIRILMKAGLSKEDIFVITGYKKELLEQIHDNTVFNEMFEKTNNGYGVYIGLKRIFELYPVLEEDVLVLDGDLLYEESLIDNLLKFNKRNVLVNKQTPYSEELKDEISIENENNEIIEMVIPQKDAPLGEPYIDKPLFSFLGILKISSHKARELMNALQNEKYWNTWYTVPLPDIVNKGEFYNFAISKDLKFCFDVDTKEDLEILNDLNKMQNKRFTILSAGPVVASEKVRNSMGDYKEIGHREPEFSNIVKDIKEKTLRVFNVPARDYSSIVVAGSGTAATECLFSSLMHSDKKTLVVSNGAFGERIEQICDVHKIPIVKVHYEWGEYPKLEDIEKKLQEDSLIEAVAMVQMETSTGMLNPVHDVGELCNKYNKTYIVDGMSGFAADPLDMVNDNIDFVITNTNKGLGGLPVIGLICYRKAALEKSRDLDGKPRTFSLDFFKHVKYSEEKNQTPFTPQIPYFIMLRAALADLLEEGVENRIQRYKRNTELMRSKLQELGFKLQFPDESQLSGLMTNYILPEGVGYQEVHDKMKQRGFVVYPGKGALEGKIIHIANLGILNEEDILKICRNMKEVIEEIGQR